MFVGRESIKHIGRRGACNGDHHVGRSLAETKTFRRFIRHQ